MTKAELISPAAEELLHQLFVRARKSRHKKISVDHLLLALVKNKALEDLWRAFNVDCKAMAGELVKHIDESTSLFDDDESVDDVEPLLEFQRVIQRAILHVQSSGRKSVEPVNILIALFGEKDSHAVQLLHQYRVSRLDIVNYSSHGIAPTQNIAPKTLTDRENIFRATVAEIQDVRVDRAGTTQTPPKLFISYSHADISCLDRLLVHLRPLQKSKSIICWSDKNIRTGDKWRQEIQRNLDEAAIAILLVSADFLASDFIVEDELPPLLVKAEAQGIRVLPVILKPCGFLRDIVLSSFQAINDPRQPLLGLNHIEQEEIYNRIADEVSEEIRSKYTARD